MQLRVNRVSSLLKAFCSKRVFLRMKEYCPWHGKVKKFLLHEAHLSSIHNSHMELLWDILACLSDFGETQFAVYSFLLVSIDIERNMSRSWNSTMSSSIVFAHQFHTVKQAFNWRNWWLDQNVTVLSGSLCKMFSPRNLIGNVIQKRALVYTCTMKQKFWRPSETPAW